MIRARKTGGIALAAAVALGACDTGPIEVAVPEDSGVRAPLLAAAPGSAAEVVFQLSPLPCPDCPGGEQNTTPSNVLHFRDVGGRFAISGDLTGEMRFFGDFHINLVKGKGPANGSVIIELTAPAAGTFECTAHAEYVDYGPATGFVFIEYTRYGGCHGTGAYEGARMVVYVTNEANPGVRLFEGTAQIW